jgi:hypothetical protein
MMDHDRNFKELLKAFFYEFVEAFLPEISAYLDSSVQPVFLDKEVFSDATIGTRHIADLVVKVRFRGQDAFFLVHVEHQSSTDTEMPLRMFTYFAQLHEKYKLPVYPVVIYSSSTPIRPEPQRYEVAFPDRTVLQFDYRVIQLNRLSWRRFLKQPNPAATALMSTMQIAPKDRAKVRAECLRLLLTLKLDPAKSEMIWSFVEAYLPLNAQEMRQYERVVAKLTPQEQESAMELISSYKKEGMERVVLRLLRRQVGELPAEIEKSIDQLQPEQIDALTDALLDMRSVEQVEDWLAEHTPQ